MLGVQRPFLNKVLKQFERRGLLAVGYRSIRVPGLSDRTGQPVQTTVSGWMAAQSNQNESVASAGVSRLPVNGPAVARPN